MYKWHLEGKAGKSLWTDLLWTEDWHICPVQPEHLLDVLNVSIQFDGLCPSWHINYNSSEEWHYETEREQEELRSKVPSSNPITFTVNFLCALSNHTASLGFHYSAHNRREWDDLNEFQAWFWETEPSWFKCFDCSEKTRLILRYPHVPFQKMSEVIPGDLFEMHWAGRCSLSTPALKSCGPVSHLPWESSQAVLSALGAYWMHSHDEWELFLDLVHQAHLPKCIATSSSLTSFASYHWLVLLGKFVLISKPLFPALLSL